MARVKSVASMVPVSTRQTQKQMCVCVHVCVCVNKYFQGLDLGIRDCGLWLGEPEICRGRLAGWIVSEKNENAVHS